ncbi:TPA: hypothetical protein ACH3X2_003202 [Trebouxia sp. C0005]
MIVRCIPVCKERSACGWLPTAALAVALDLEKISHGADPGQSYEHVPPSDWKPEAPETWIELHRRAYCSHMDAAFPVLSFVTIASVFSFRLLSPGLLMPALPGYTAHVAELERSNKKTLTELADFKAESKALPNQGLIIKRLEAQMGQIKAQLQNQEQVTSFPDQT